VEPRQDGRRTPVIGMSVPIQIEIGHSIIVGGYEPQRACGPIGSRLSNIFDNLAQ
jgi:hypothetical protein